MLLESLHETSSEFPIGSKVFVDLNGRRTYCMKVVGYDHSGALVLLYNPEIGGHDGMDRACNDLGIPLSASYLGGKYGDTLCFFPKDWVTLLVKPAWLILKEECESGRK